MPRGSHRPRCRHCHARPATYGRGLCSRCFLDRAIRDLYPPLRATGPGQGVGQTAPLKAASVATDAPPGSPGKLLELARRAAAGEELYHAKDAKACLR